jgi:hypothetical protein
MNTLLISSEGNPELLLRQSMTTKLIIKANIWLRLHNALG